MVEIKSTFSRRELLWFGPLFALFAGMIGGVARWRFAAPEVAQGIWIFSAALIALYYLVPALRRGIFTGWLAAVFPLGWLLSHVLLAAVFYLVVFPIGFLMKLFRYDALQRRFDRDAESYWIEREPKRDARDYFRQY